MENIGTAPEKWSYSASALLDRESRQYAHDLDATFWGNVRDDNEDFGDRLNPGQAAAGALWFDIPEDTAPVLLVLLPDPYSDRSVGVRLE